MDLTRDVKIGEHTYQIGRFSARDGSWMVNQFLTRGLFYALEPQEDGKELGEKELGGLLAVAMRGFSEEDFEKIRVKCLRTCLRYDTPAAVPIPLLMADGRWAVASPPDLVETLALLVNVLTFNLHCFFAPGALAVLQTAFPSSPSKAGQMDTSSDQ